MGKKAKDAAKKVKKMVKDADNKISKALAADILDAILADGKYSAAEQKTIQDLRDSDEVTFTKNTEKWLGRQLSNFNLAKHREEMMEEAKSRLLPGLMEAAGNNNSIGMDDAKKIVEFITEDGTYSEEEQDTMDYLYNSGRMSAAVEKYIQGELREWRANKAHEAWVKKHADANIKKIVGDNFKDAKITRSVAKDLLAAIFKDGQYSDREQTSVNNLYRNATWTKGTKELFISRIRSFCRVLAVDGEVVGAFKDAVEKGKKQVTKGNVDQIVKELKLGTGRDASVHRTLGFCMDMFTFSSESAEKAMEDAIEADLDARAEKRAAVVQKLKEAANAEPPKEVETKSTGEKYTPSATLLAKYEELKNKRGQITMRTAEDFVAQLFLDHKYTKNEQAAMQDLRDEEVFTEAANKYILYRIRSFVATRNFSDK